MLSFFKKCIFIDILPAIDFRLPTDATEDTQAASEEIQKTAEALVEATKDGTEFEEITFDVTQ